MMHDSESTLLHSWGNWTTALNTKLLIYAEQPYIAYTRNAMMYEITLRENKSVSQNVLFVYEY